MVLIMSADKENGVVKVPYGSKISPVTPKEVSLKFLVIGEYGVGKTAIVRRYTEGKFSSNYKITIGADFAIKSVLWNSDTKINLQLWDIAGHERFGYMTRVYYKYAVAAVVVFDVSRLATFQTVDKWVKDLREKVTLANGCHIPVVLLANKADIPSDIPNDVITKVCKQLGISKWFCTSAKDGTNIDEAFQCLIEHAMNNDTENLNPYINNNEAIKLTNGDNKPVKEEFKCCR